MKVSKADRDAAIARLRDWIKPGDTVYTILESVSRSGMSREIRVLVPYQNAPEDVARGRLPIDFIHPNHAVSQALGIRQGKRDGLIVGGCGMDMGFHLVYELSATLYGSGYACLGKGKCPSNYHVNHRDRVRCPGIEDADERTRFCYRPDRWGGEAPPADWPRGPERTIDHDGASVTLPGSLLACIHYDPGTIPIGTRDLIMHEDGSALQVCPTCHGAGDLANPDGPERFDLTHTDGYAIRHRWL